MRDKPLDTTEHKLWYKPLEKTKNEIRVLKFLNLSSPVSTGDTIQCSIRNVSLGTPRRLQLAQYSWQGQKLPIIWDRFAKSVDLRDSTLNKSTDTGLHPGSAQCSGSRYDWGDFEALSYTWGNTGETKAIHINGIRKSVSRNLEEALRALWNQEETLLGMCYWVDSLCIDQENIEERNEQVKRMKEIYGRARAVVVWLGQEEEMDRITVQIMQTRYPSNDLLLSVWPSLFAFTQKPYWKRCWIIQELAMNHNSTLFLCGKLKLTRGMIQRGIRWSQISLVDLVGSEHSNCQLSHNLHSEAFDMAERIHVLTELTFKTDFGISPKSLLDLVRQADATDERDKIYSILGLLDPAISAGVTPDYSLSVQQVYTNYVKSAIKASGKLDQIVLKGIAAEEGWSSWVPDWRKPFQRYIHYMIPQQASRDIPARFRFIEKEKDRTYLACRGFHVDAVDGIAAEPPLGSHATRFNTASNRYSGQTLETIQQSFKMGEPEVSGELAFKVPWNLSRDSNDSLANIPSNPDLLKLSQSSHFERWDKFRKYNEDFCIGGQKLRTFFPQSNEQDVHIVSTLRCVRSVLRALDHRSLITTRTGYVGLAPVETCPGDVVAILLGCCWPVVLRPCYDGLYQLIGECYIHGLMDGEIFDQQQDEHLSEQEFVLC